MKIEFCNAYKKAQVLEYCFVKPIKSSSTRILIDAEFG